MRLLTLRSILVATDLDDSSFGAVTTAVQLAAAAGASLHVLHVVGAHHDEPGQAAAKAELSALVTRAGNRREDVTTHVLAGEPAFAIGTLSDHVHADVIVLGPHRERHTRGRALGGTALAVVTTASSPCLVVRTPLRLPLGQVLVPIDLSDTARGALLVGLSWASALRSSVRETAHRADASLTALHVQRPLAAAGTSAPAPIIEREIAFTREAGGTWAGVTIHGEVTANADVTRGIADFVSAHAPDMVIIGTRGLGLDTEGRLGSVAASVMTAIDTPTLLVPPAVWSSYVTTSPRHRGDWTRVTSPIHADHA